MDIDLNTNNPLNFNEWVSRQETMDAFVLKERYSQYLINWYSTQKIKNDKIKRSLKEDYIQLLKDLNFLFNKDEKDKFLNNIDFQNDEDLILAIPFFAKKLKQISQLLSFKRESVKDSKVKYNLVGSNFGFEKLLYDYILRGFTNSPNELTTIPYSTLSKSFPALSSVKDDFYIEVEELYDPNTYFDSDPSIDISNYLNIDDLEYVAPLDGLYKNEIISLIATRYLPKIANTPLSNLFNAYLNEDIATESPFDNLSSSSVLINNQIFANRKYAGETIYGLTAVRLKDVYLPDKQIAIDFKGRNTWFIWPSGDRLLDEFEFNNTFAPIYLNDSNFLNSGSTAGSSLDTSDLIFTDKNGFVEGAWLNGFKVVKVKDDLVLKINKQSYKDFIYPFVGFNLSTKGNDFLSYSIKDDIYDNLNILDAKKKKDLIITYNTSVLPNSSIKDIYLNQTKLVKCGSYADSFSDSADTITKKQKTYDIPILYNDYDYTPLEEAFLYKFDKTDLPIQDGINNIYWPLETIDETTNSPLSIDMETCLPISLKDIDVSKNMLGSVAGLNFGTSDIIYKLNTKGGEPIEAAWLSTNSITNYDIIKDSYKVYNTNATKCSQYIDGPAQAGLTLIIQPAEKMSFVWGDVDTPADQVFKYVSHSSSCPYGNNEHDYFEDQDYRNPNPLFSKNYWNDCECRSVQYSPIGHIGEKFTDYNAMADFIFADPDGVGSDFTISNWTDTRGFNYKNSPQFAYYNLYSTGNKDKTVGWGNGEWKNGNGTQFILKTGRRYTYYRSSFRKSLEDRNKSPYYVVKYPYKNINGYVKNKKPLDLVIILDTSKSQILQIDNIKKIISNFLRTTLVDKNEIDIQISILTFGTDVSTVSYLTKDLNLLDLYVNSVNYSTNRKDFKTNIADALLIAKDILTKPSPKGAGFDIKDLCKKLGYVLANPVEKAKYVNNPNVRANKKIIIFTNGVETINNGKGVLNANNLKQSGIDVYVIDSGAKDERLSINEKIVSSPSNYFNLENYLIFSDNDLESFANLLLYRLNNLIPLKPTWSKAIRNESGAWIETNEASDMVLSPGDYLIYVHRKNIEYETNGIINKFISTTPSFTINVHLDGWDYTTNSFNKYAVGEGFGAKPFWAKVYTDIDKKGNFKKQTMKFGGDLRFFNDYVPIHQPEISNMILKNGDFLRYKRIQNEDLKWVQPLTFDVTLVSNKWKKLFFTKQISNLSNFLATNKIQTSVVESDELSDILLESYSSFNLAYYNYYARKDFTYTQDLFFKNRCTESFVLYNTAAVISPTEPYSNILNAHYPTIATISFPSDATTTKETGEYLRPDKLGVPTYRGVGYNISIDNDSLTYFDSISAERMFFDINKFGPRQRGLTKKDQITPTKINEINSNWMYEPYGNGEKTGVITETLNTQKFTPYQTSYEIERENKYGISRQVDDFQFFTNTLPSLWDNPIEYPLTFRNEITLEQYTKRKSKLLVNAGEMQKWRTDIFGNNYGLFKQVLPSSIKNLSLWVTSDYGTLSAILPDKNTSNDGKVIRWMDKSGNQRHLNAYNVNTELNSSFLKPMNPPVLKSNYINGKPAIYFDGTSNLHLNYYLRNAKELTVYVVGKYLNVNTGYSKNNYQPLLSFSLSSGSKKTNNNYFDNETFCIYQENGINAFGFGNTVVDSKNPNVSGNPIVFKRSVDGVSEIQNTDVNFNMFEFLFTPTYASSYINNQYYINTTDLGRSLNKNLNMADINLSDGMWVGSYGAGQYPTACAIAEIIVFERALNNKERIDMNNYLSDKYFNGFY